MLLNNFDPPSMHQSHRARRLRHRRALVLRTEPLSRLVHPASIAGAESSIQRPLPSRRDSPPITNANAPARNAAYTHRIIFVSRTPLTMRDLYLPKFVTCSTTPPPHSVAQKLPPLEGALSRARTRKLRSSMRAAAAKRQTLDRATRRHRNGYRMRWRMRTSSRSMRWR
jgi:hypothetical protein